MAERDMGIQDDLKRQEELVNQYIGLVKACTALAVHEGVPRKDAARWLLIKKFHEALPAVEIGMADWLITSLGDKSTESAYEILWSLVGVDEDDDADDLEDVFWPVEEFANKLVECGIVFDERPEDSDDPDNDAEQIRHAIVEIPTTTQLAQDVARLAPRAETTYLNIIGALLEILTAEGPTHGMPLPFSSQSELLKALEKYRGYPGMSERNLQAKFAAAKRSISQP